MMWLLAAVVVVAGAAFAADDDLAVVKKAVATGQTAPSPLPAEAPPQAAPAGKAGKAEPRWLRVRVHEKDVKGETRKRVAVNLPLSLVRAMDDLPIDLCGHHYHGWKDKEEAGHEGRRCELKIGDVLAALQSGQELVEIEADDATVKVWVD
jgi:hypothetical protein